MPPKLKLVYFNIRGRGELIRLTLHAGGVEFIDDRIEYADWPQRRAVAPNGALPYIEVSGQMYGEALPIVRFLGKKCGLLGGTEQEQLYVDIVLNQVNSLRNDIARIRMDPILNKAQQKYLEDKLRSEKVPEFLSRTEEALSQVKAGFLFGGKLTVADLAVWDTVDLLLTESPTLLENFPKLREHRLKIKNLPRLKKYLSSRPETKL